MRAWVVLKQENGRGTHAAWFATIAAAGSEKGVLVPEGEAEGLKSLKHEDVGDDESGKDLKERQVVRSQRRQRSGSSAAGTLPGSPDLLTIPGVGPRNFKKLVEKGFEGVAQLKQLYRDKV